VEIEVSNDGHFYVDAEINLGQVRMMVDTGATAIALRESDALEAGIRPHPGDFVYPVQTANGTTNAAEAQLDMVSIGGIEIDNVRALVIRDDQLAISLLGGSYLSRLARFEIAGGTLIFEN
jgi:aspartyl protease family protein